MKQDLSPARLRELIKAGKADMALDAAAKLNRDTYQQDQIKSNIANELAMAGKIEKSLDVINSIKYQKI